MASVLSFADYAEAVAYGQGVAGDPAFILTKAEWKEGGFYWSYQLLSTVANVSATPYPLLPNDISNVFIVSRKLAAYCSGSAGLV